MRRGQTSHRGRQTPISEAERRRMISAYVHGVPIKHLEARFHRNHNVIRAIVDEHLKEQCEKLLNNRLAKYVGQPNTHDLRERMIVDLSEEKL